MKTTLLILSLFSFSVLQGQSLKQYTISNSGCTLYSYCTPKFQKDFSEDSSTVYTGECKVGDLTYGVICIKLLNPVDNLVMAEDLMISYLDYLKLNFEIKKAAGYGKGHQLNNDPDTRGILDYWEDAAGDKWKIKAWTDGNFIGFMYAYTQKEIPESRVNAYLEGFRLPGK